MPLADLFRKAVKVSNGRGNHPPTEEMFGHYAAMGAMGHGVGLWDALGAEACRFVGSFDWEFSWHELDPKTYPDTRTETA